jgi:H+/Cl- antiporter ClcA
MSASARNDVTDAAPTPPSPPADPAAVLRSRRYVALLVLACVVGVLISLLAWGFLEVVHDIQQAIYVHLPSGLGFDDMPWWWPLPVLVLAALPAAFAESLPGAGGHVPAEGLKVATTTPDMLLGILIAALASLGLGVVLGPEAPLIALGGGFTLLLVSQLKKDVPQQALLVLGAAGSFAAISMIFESPVVAAVLVIEATGLGGPTLPIVLLPGLLAAGVGSLTFIGMSHWVGLDTSAYSIPPLSLPSFDAPTWADIGWSVLLAVAAAAVVFAVRRLGLGVARLPARRPYLVLPVAGVAIAVAAIIFDQLTDHGVEQVLFSGQDSLPGLVANSSTWSAGALVLVIACKGIAWAVSLGTFRGGPTFPALYIGAAGGLLASHLPGLGATPAVAVGMTAMAASMLRLPLSSIVITTALTLPAGPGSAPLIIVAAVTAYLVTIWLSRTDEVSAPPETPPSPRSADAANV